MKHSKKPKADSLNLCVNLNKRQVGEVHPHFSHQYPPAVSLLSKVFTVKIKKSNFINISYIEQLFGK
jgi:hypothetical protein